ncbi:disease resistance-like protein DSC1 [Morus notabilis]|uniref:disease resistance-like protein DSC1 n=1 Tax=Morus notabilis TaxID=981085 RepID=UPI000CED0415|nr:disease resistance-like protein DSC1 [Morus notabilis]
MDACASSSFSSSSSSIFNLEKYDVFLSFKGEDTRNTFTSHLYSALERKKIKTYIDEKSLERGDKISPALVEAIWKSKISIIIFSKNYASSSWCLMELVHILERHTENKHMVIPIFYEVDPSHIRKQEGSYGDTFLKHEARFNDSMEILQKWIDALRESANLSGWDSRVIRPESKLVEAIVEDVLRKLNSDQSSNFTFEGLFGIDKHIERIKGLLNVSSPKVQIVGIWGMGGIGKTTLAEVVFNKISSEFEARCFVANVREESEKGSLVSLRNKLLAELLKEEHLNLGTPSLGPTFVKERLRRTKVLVVVDDVYHVEQLKSLIGDRDQYSGESRIIITTRDAMLLRKISADGVYEVKELNCDEALQLFNFKAFKENSRITEHLELSKKVVKYAGGNPLAITVLGSYFGSLRSKKEESWEMAFSKLKVVPHNDILNVLRISYDELDETEKNIFLDIACFFNRMSRDYVENILNACGFFANNGIDDLIDKSLITIKYKELWMHDLLQEMGQKIVCQESADLGKRSRLWIAEDAYQVLENNEGTTKIQGIFLDKSKIDGDIHLEPTIFSKMHNLRLFKIYNSSYVKKGKVYLHDLQCLPRSLRYLEWHEYPLKYLPSNFKPKNLVELKMPYSQLEQLWVGVQELNKLRGIDLRQSIYLTQIPDLSSARNLERINLAYCRSLLQFPLHILRNLNRHIEVNLSYCDKLQSLPLEGSNLDTFPMNISRSMVSLDLSSTGIMSLPSSIDSLNNLSKLSLNNCTRLANLPSFMNKLDSLKELNLGGCSILETFPEVPLNIKSLDIHGTAIKEVASSSIEGRFDLQYINMLNCKSLASLPSNIFKMRSLIDLNLDGCSNLKNLPEISEPMKSLEILHLSRTGIRELPSSIGYLISVQELEVMECENLESVPTNICTMAALSDLDLSDCPRLEYFPMPSGFLRWDLEHLHLSNSNIIELPRSIKGLSKLRQIHVNNCKNLRSIPELPLGLQILHANGCSSLEIVSNSKRALTQEFWDYVDIEGDDIDLEFSTFADCLKLDQKQRQNILIDFQLRVFRTVTQFVYGDNESLPSSNISCFPGNEIPKWFEYQSEGSYMKLPLEWQNSNFLGFVLCTVGYSYSDIKLKLDLRCEISLRQGENDEFPLEFSGVWDHYFIVSFTSHSSNLCMWYCVGDWSECLDAVEASFDFLFIDWDQSKGYWVKSSNVEVKKCGIHMLYQKDIEEFRFNFIDAVQHLVLEESATTPDQPESSARGTVDFETDEPQRKKIKFTDSCGG